ncbi:MAG: hypothetical protein QM484_00745 [Woeseiaceae bacterium]
MNIHIRLLLISLLISTLTACGGGDYYYDSTGIVQLENDNSSLSIREFNFSPFDQSTWGANQLSSPLLAGLYFDISSVPIGTYDARVLVEGLYSTYSTFLYDVPVIEESIATVVSTDSGYTGSLKIVNGTVDAKIIGLYLSPSTSSVWRENQIDSQIVPSGSMHLFDVNTGLYDVKVVWDVGPDSFYFDKSIESLSLLTLTVS